MFAIKTTFYRDLYLQLEKKAKWLNFDFREITPRRPLRRMNIPLSKKNGLKQHIGVSSS